MSSDKILQQFKFHNGVDQFSDTSPAAYPVGNPRRLFFSNTHNGVSGCPLDSFMDSGIIHTFGEWTLERAYFDPATYPSTDYKNILDYIADVSKPMSVIYMSDDGIHFFGQYLLTIYSWTLSTPFEIGSATFDSGNNFSVGYAISAFCLNTDGDILYVYYHTLNRITQYSLSTPFDLTTASEVGFYNIGSSQYFLNLRIINDGSIMYGSRSSSPYWFKTYSLSTPFDITTLSSVDSSLAKPNANMSDDGINIISEYRQYTLGTPYYSSTKIDNDVSFLNPYLTDSYLNRENATDVVKLDAYSGYITTNGKYLLVHGTFIRHPGSNQYCIIGINLSNNCTTCWNIDNLAYNAKTVSVSSEETSPHNLTYSQEGVDAYLVGSDTGEIHRYITITNPYQLSAFSFSSSKDISATDTTPLDIYLGYCNNFNSYNEVYLHNIFILGGQNNTIYRFQSSDNFTFTFSLLQSFSVASQTTSPKSFIFSSGGKKLYVLASNGTIYQYSNSVAFTFNSTTFDSITYSVTQDNDCVAIRFDRSGFNLFIAGNQNKKIYHFTLNTRWDISTASFNTEYYVGSQVSQLVGLTISPLGDNFQVVSSGVGADIYQYDIT